MLLRARDVCGNNRVTVAIAAVSELREYIKRAKGGREQTLALSCRSITGAAAASIDARSFLESLRFVASPESARSSGREKGYIAISVISEMRYLIYRLIGAVIISIELKSRDAKCIPIAGRRYREGCADVRSFASYPSDLFRDSILKDTPCVFSFSLEGAASFTGLQRDSYATFMAEIKNGRLPTFRRILRAQRPSKIIHGGKTRGSDYQLLVSTLFALIITRSVQVCIVYTMHQAATRPPTQTGKRTHIYSADDNAAQEGLGISHCVTFILRRFIQAARAANVCTLDTFARLKCQILDRQINERVRRSNFSRNRLFFTQRGGKLSNSVVTTDLSQVI